VDPFNYLEFSEPVGEEEKKEESKSNADSDALSSLRSLLANYEEDNRRGRSARKEQEAHLP